MKELKLLFKRELAGGRSLIDSGLMFGFFASLIVVIYSAISQGELEPTEKIFACINLIWLILPLAATVCSFKLFEDDLASGALYGLLEDGFKGWQIFFVKASLSAIFTIIAFFISLLGLFLLLNLESTLLTPLLFYSCIVGAIGIAVLTSLVAPLVLTSSPRGAFLPMIELPFLLPLIIAGAEASKSSLSNLTNNLLMIQILIIITIVYFLLGIILFKYVVNE
ncbi:MAG TPA: heme exporter protein CcmB [Oligoflexia bacterium]|nr:heme exporter protein CcmB [Oligoflexia bacterium]HMP27406.1 heme exporter protein CcmB [Oligoflexia bacterium]